MVVISDCERLTPRQRDCLRLVSTLRETKKIAAALGLSPHTVEQHLKAARATLAVSDREEAARILQAFEDRPPQRLVSQPDLVAPQPETAPTRTGSDPGSIADRNVVMVGLLWVFGVLILSRGRRPNDLSIEDRVSWMIRIGWAMLLLFAAALAILFAFNAYFTRLSSIGGSVAG